MLRPQSTSVQLAIFSSDLSRSHNNKHHHWLALQITFYPQSWYHWQWNDFLATVKVAMFYATCNNAKIEYNQFTTGATWAWNWPQLFSSSQSSPSRWLPPSLLMAITNNWQAVWQMATEWQLTRWIDKVDKVDQIEQYCQVDLGYKVEHHNQVDQFDQVDQVD